MSLFTDLNEPGVAGVDYGNRVLLVHLRSAMMFSVEISMACTIGIF